MTSNRESIKDFVTTEFFLLDHGLYNEWVNLFDDEAVYWNPTEASRDQELEEARFSANQVYRNRSQLEHFAERANGDVAWALQNIKVDRYVTNVLKVDDEKFINASKFPRSKVDGHSHDEIHNVYAKWLMLVEDMDSQTIFSGSAYYQLLREDDWKILLKKVIVSNSDINRSNLPPI